MSVPTTREEEYLEAVSEVVGRKGYAKVNDVSVLLDVAPSSVTEMFKRLAEEGYVNYERYSGVTLTNKGLKVASRLQARHDLLQDFFVLMGMEGEVADQEACRLEHTILPDTLELLSSFMEYLKDTEDETGMLEGFRRWRQGSEE